MGRRLLLILGFLLTAPAGGRLALGQEEGQNRPPAAPAPAPAPSSGEADMQSPIPEDLRLPPAPDTSQVVEPGVSLPASPAGEEPSTSPGPVKPKSPKTKKQTAKDREQDLEKEKEIEPPHELDDGLDVLMRKAQPAAGQGPDSHPDRRERRAHAAQEKQDKEKGAAAPPNPVPEGAETSDAPVDRLPLGKQSVAVTVDVQAPSSMNLNQEASLKLIVRNTAHPTP